MREKILEEKRNAGLPLRNAIILGIIFVTAFCFLCIKIEHTRTGYEISKNKQKRMELTKEGQALSHELSKLKSPEFIEPIAKKMGFRFATYKDVVFVEEVVLAGNTE